MNKLIQCGEKLLITHGAYSDYHILAIVEATASFDADFALKEYRTWAAMHAAGTLQDRYTFLMWLITVKQVLQEVSVDLREWHLGDYRLGDSDYDVGPWRDVTTEWIANEKRLALKELEAING